jgi:DNA-directed RNA polymerase subunit RPC12/RpoP
MMTVKPLEIPEMPAVAEHRTQLWYTCPRCGKKLFTVSPRAVIRGMVIRCRGCKEDIKVNI